MNKALKIFLAGLSGLTIGAVIFAVVVYVAVRQAWPKTRIQRLESSDRVHRAELIRLDGIDRNYFVRVDGHEVYGSPDFSPRRDMPFRETLVWDVKSKIVILEVAHQRIFGFDTSTKQRLTDEELLAVELPPDPELWKYGFESEWPGIGRAHPPAVTNQ